MTTVQTSKAGFELNKTAISSSTSKKVVSFQSQFYGHPLNTDTVYFFPWGKKALAISLWPRQGINGALAVVSNGTVCISAISASRKSSKRWLIFRLLTVLRSIKYQF